MPTLWGVYLQRGGGGGGGVRGVSFGEGFFWGEGGILTCLPYFHDKEWKTEVLDMH